MTNKAVWILGQGGFLGTDLVELSRKSNIAVFNGEPIPWADSKTRVHALKQNIDAFVEFSQSKKRQIIWAAGSSGVGAGSLETDSEYTSFSDFVSVLNDTSPIPNTTFYLCSSAGGVYAKSSNPPYSSDSPTIPQSRYGELKLAMEAMAIEGIATNYPVTIGRLSNLYGPWSGTRQGLINRLCLAALERRAINLFVPMNTVRDYLYVSDAASLIINSIPPSESEAKIEVLASGFNTTISQAIATVSSVAHRKVPVSIGTDAAAQQQPEDLRLVPSWLEDNPEFAPIDLATGAQRVLTYLTTRTRGVFAG